MQVWSKLLTNRMFHAFTNYFGYYWNQNGLKSFWNSEGTPSSLLAFFRVRLGQLCVNFRAVTASKRLRIQRSNAEFLCFPCYVTHELHSSSFRNQAVCKAFISPTDRFEVLSRFPLAFGETKRTKLIIDTIKRFFHFLTRTIVTTVNMGVTSIFQIPNPLVRRFAYGRPVTSCWFLLPLHPILSTIIKRNRSAIQDNCLKEDNQTDVSEFFSRILSVCIVREKINAINFRSGLSTVTRLYVENFIPVTRGNGEHFIKLGTISRFLFPS